MGRWRRRAGQGVRGGRVAVVGGAVTTRGPGAAGSRRGARQRPAAGACSSAGWCYSGSRARLVRPYACPLLYRWGSRRRWASTSATQSLRAKSRYGPPHSPSCVEPLRARHACAGGLLQPSGAAVRYQLRVAAVICGAPVATLVTQPWSLRRGGVRGGSSETCTRASPRRVGPRGCHPPLSPSPAPHASSRSDSAARRRPRRSRPANLAR